MMYQMGFEPMQLTLADPSKFLLETASLDHSDTDTAGSYKTSLFEFLDARHLERDAS